MIYGHVVEDWLRNLNYNYRWQRSAYRLKLPSVCASIRAHTFELLLNRAKSERGVAWSRAQEARAAYLEHLGNKDLFKQYTYEERRELRKVKQLDGMMTVLRDGRM